MTAEWNTGSLDLDACRRLVGSELTVEYADVRTTRHAVRDDEASEVLAGLDVVLTGDELDRLRLVLGQR